MLPVSGLAPLTSGDRSNRFNRFKTFVTRACTVSETPSSCSATSGVNETPALMSVYQRLMQKSTRRVGDVRGTADVRCADPLLPHVRRDGPATRGVLLRWLELAGPFAEARSWKSTFRHSARTFKKLPRATPRRLGDSTPADLHADPMRPSEHLVAATCRFGGAHAIDPQACVAKLGSTVAGARLPPEERGVSAPSRSCPCRVASRPLRVRLLTGRPQPRPIGQRPVRCRTAVRPLPSRERDHRRPSAPTTFDRSDRRSRVARA
jgi:hypothetical protein